MPAAICDHACGHGHASLSGSCAMREPSIDPVSEYVGSPLLLPSDMAGLYPNCLRTAIVIIEVATAAVHAGLERRAHHAIGPPVAGVAGSRPERGAHLARRRCACCSPRAAAARARSTYLQTHMSELRLLHPQRYTERRGRACALHVPEVPMKTLSASGNT